MVCRKKTGKEKKQARIVSQVFSEFSENLKCYTEFCGELQFWSKITVLVSGDRYHR